MKVFCEVCDKNITEAGETSYVCDECNKLVCGDCCTGGFHNVCTECSG